MAVTRDATGAGNTTTGAACTASHTVATGGTTTIVLAFVAISVSSNSSSTTCASTYGGTAMTQLGLTLLGSSTNRSAYGIYYLFNPATGAQNCVATPGGASTKAGVRLSTVSYTGVDTIGAMQSAAALTISATSATNGYNIFGHINGVTMTTPSQSQRVLLGSAVSGVGDFLLVQDAAGTGSNITFSVSGTATTPSTFGVALSPPPVPGPKIDTFVDTFDSYDATKWNLDTGASVTGGQMVLTCANTGTNTAYTTNNWGGSVVNPNYDLTASSITIQLVQPPNIGNGTTLCHMSLHKEVDFNGQNTIRIYWEAGVTYFNYIIGGVADWSTSVTTSDGWWRISESGGSIIWWTSADGISWTNRRSATATTAIENLYVQLVTRFTGTEPAPGTAVFDNLNNPPAAGSLEIFKIKRVNYGALLQM